MTWEEAVRRMYADGQQRWPAIQLEFDLFRRHCLAVLGPEPPADVPRYGADLYLCCACGAHMPWAIATFERETDAVARTAIARIRSDPEFVEETLQALYSKLLLAPDAKVTEYSGRGSLQAWMRVTAARAAIDGSRARRLAWARRGDLSEHLNSSGAGPESSLARAQYAEAFQRALQKALAELSSEDRNLLRMHVVGRCSIDQIGRVHGVHRATAARWLERARTTVFDSVRRQLRLEHGPLTDSEFLSLAQTMGSELELSLSADSSRPAVPPSHPVT